MGVRILFLGTAGDAMVAGKQQRSSGGVIFNYESNQFHLDPGPGSLLMAKAAGVNLRENTAIFVTGNDMLRANDVNAVISAMTHGGLDKIGVLVCPSSVAESEKGSPFLNKEYRQFLEKTILIDNTEKIGINDIDIKIVKLKDSIANNCGFKFMTQKFSLGYVPQTPYSNLLVEGLEGSDILIFGVTTPGEAKTNEVMGTKDIEKLVKQLNPQLVILTSFGIKMLQADPLYQAREIQKSTGIQVIAAKDGMTINPLSFTATVRQKSLKGF
ncbi:MAG: MBL fold metallo-hydrolase [Nanoarchaeota archaeon]